VLPTIPAATPSDDFSKVNGGPRRQQTYILVDGVSISLFTEYKLEQGCFHGRVGR